MSNINKLVFEAMTRFRPKIYRKSIQKQRSVYAGQLASNLAKQKAPGIDARKSFFRRKYLEFKAKEQRMFGSRARSLSRRK